MSESISILAKEHDIKADIGDASGSTKGSLYSIVGNPGTDDLTTVGGQLADAALGKNADDSGAQTQIALLRSLIDRIGNVGTSNLDALLDTGIASMENPNVLANTITLSVNNGTQSLNCFEVTGTVRVSRLYAEIIDTTTLTNCTAAFFELDDGVVQSAITLNNGVLSGMVVDTFMAKTATSGVVLSIANSATGVITEPAAGKNAFQRFFATKKRGANTYIRFTYTSTNTPIDAQIRVYVEYKGMGDDGALAVV